MASNFAKALIINMISKAKRAVNSKKHKVTYTTTLDDTRGSEGTARSYSFIFSSPIAETGLEDSSLFADLNNGLDAQSLGVVSNVLAELGFDTQKVGKQSSKGSVEVEYETEDEELEEETNLAIRTKTGRFMSKPAFSALLELLTKQYMMKEMTKGAPILVNRTGRFINSASIFQVNVLPPKTSKGRQELLIAYKYMNNPYKVFDPTSGNKLASNARNPQRIIGEAIAKAARDITSEKYYEISVGETR